MIVTVSEMIWIILTDSSKRLYIINVKKFTTNQFKVESKNIHRINYKWILAEFLDNVKMIFSFIFISFVSSTC